MTRRASSCWASKSISRDRRSAKSAPRQSPGISRTAHSKWGSSISARLGYAADRALLYVTGGAAFASIETSILFTGISVGWDGTRVGWTAGAGVDYAFTGNWFTGLEYRYSQYQSQSFVYPIPVLNLGIVGLKQELSKN
ncbi:outer membrane protein [Bradyrhizobium sp. RDM12]